MAIIGGGVAALTLALEILRARPQTRLLVVEPNPYPAPEITHTVGESTVEISAQYLRDRLGLADHWNTAQIRKMGLRMFFSHDGNTDIARRMELGSSSFTAQVTYQIDRGRLENELTRRCLSVGVSIVSGRVRSVEFGHGNRPHSLSIQDGEAIIHKTARWVADASGRNRALPRQLELRRPNEHNCNAVWLRVAAEIDVGQWSDEPNWQARLIEGDRAMSTNHLMGRGLLGLAYPACLRSHQRRHCRRPCIPRVHRFQHAGQSQKLATRTRAAMRRGIGRYRPPDQRLPGDEELQSRRHPGV